MRVAEYICDIKAITTSQKKLGKTIGFVPTMGYLHEGHLSLVRNSILENDFTVVSIFVNPTQFAPNEDFSKYPRNLERDLGLIEQAGGDVVFTPKAEELYPNGYCTYVNVEVLTDVLCGSSRPSHFKGVTTVVSKLFNIVEPNKAYFGSKDAQQAIVIKKMVEDLNMSTEVVLCPTVREADGLAMSSRNVYLSPDQRRKAVVLSRSLFEAEAMIKSGEVNKEKVIESIKATINSVQIADIDYVNIVDADSLADLDVLKGRVLVALAVRFGATRLIDNIIVEVSKCL